MKKMNKSLQAAGAAAVIILAAGCAAETITAEYVMPPNAVSEIKDIDTMELITVARITDNSVPAGDQTYAVGTLNQRVAARFCQEGFFRSTDFVWGNPGGASKLAEVVLTKENIHGYVRHTTDLISKRAKLYLTLDVKVTTSQIKKNKEFVLKDIPFKKSMVGRMPVGKPDMARATIKKATVPVDVFTRSATGKLTVRLVNKKGIVVYKKSFDDLKNSYETSMEKHISLPSKSEIVMEMLIPAIETVVSDLSPHKEIRELAINEDGDEKGCLLLKAQAFTTAIERLDEVLANKEKKNHADYENRGLAYEIIGDYAAAKSDFEAAVKINLEAKIAREGLQRVNNILESKAALRKMDATKTGTNYKKSEF